MAVTIQEFLVALGFKVNQQQFNQFQAGVHTASQGVTDLGKSLAETTAALSFGMLRIGDQFEQLYFMSQRTGATAGQLTNVAFAARQVGSSAEAASNMLTTLRQDLQLPGIFQSYIKQITGFRGEINNTKQASDLLLDHWSRLQKAGRIQQIEWETANLGLSYEEQRPRILNRDEERAEEERDRRRYQNINLKGITEDSHELMKAWRDFNAEMFVFPTMFQGEFQGKLTSVLRWATGQLENIQKHIEDLTPHQDPAHPYSNTPGVPGGEAKQALVLGIGGLVSLWAAKLGLQGIVGFVTRTAMRAGGAGGVSPAAGAAAGAAPVTPSGFGPATPGAGVWGSAGIFRSLGATLLGGLRGGILGALPLWLYQQTDFYKHAEEKRAKFYKEHPESIWEILGQMLAPSAKAAETGPMHPVRRTHGDPLRLAHGAPTEGGGDTSRFGLELPQVTGNPIQDLGDWLRGSSAFTPAVRLVNLEDFVGRDTGEPLAGGGGGHLGESVGGRHHGPRLSGGDVGPLNPPEGGPVGGAKGDAARALYAYGTQKLGLEPEHVKAMLANELGESSFNPRAVGPSGEQGSFQWSKQRWPGVQKSLGDRQWDLFAQFDYAVEEIKKMNPGWFARKGDAKFLTRDLEDWFENPKVKTGREDYLRQIEKSVDPSSYKPQVPPTTNNTKNDHHVSIDNRTNISLAGGDFGQHIMSLDEMLARQNGDMVRNLSGALA